MNVKMLAMAALAMAITITAQAAEGLTAIVGAHVVHPERESGPAVDPDQTVIIAGDRIVAVGPARTTRVPRGATRIEAKGKWIVPGLVDAHVHFFQSGNLYTRPDASSRATCTRAPMAPTSAPTCRTRRRTRATVRGCRRRSRCGSRAA
jgi:imidazolonepropionase-like amidohydrolase